MGISFNTESLLTLCGIDLILRGQESRRRGPVEVRRGGKALVHSNKLHAAADLRPHGTEGRQCREDQLQQLADPSHLEQRKGRGRQSAINHLPRLCKSSVLAFLALSLLIDEQLTRPNPDRRPRSGRAPDPRAHDSRGREQALRGWVPDDVQPLCRGVAGCA